MKRRLAREMTVQSLYQMEMNEVSAEEAVNMVLEEANHDNEANMEITDENNLKQFVIELVEETYKIKEYIDNMLAQYLKGYQMDRLSRVDRQVLRLAAYEMVFREDVPPKVVINEAIELSKHFGMEDSGKFVNGVLGKMIKELDQLKQTVSAEMKI